MSRTYTPGEIRDIGNVTCPAIAASYDLIGSAADGLEIFNDGLFGTHAISENYIVLVKIFTKAIIECPISYEAMGRTLIEIANDCEEDEDEIIKDLNDTMEDLPTIAENHRGDVVQEIEDEEARLEEERRENAERNQRNRPQPI